MSINFIIFTFVFFSLIIAGCAPQKKIHVKETVESRQFERLMGPREAAVLRYGYKGIEENIIAESPVITPAYAKPGDLIRQELQFILLSQNAEELFIISEAVTILIGKESVELLRRETEKEQGIHLSVVQITLPQDLKPGEYTLITTISSGETKKTVTGSFSVKK
jgi:hypothetical protein